MVLWPRPRSSTWRSTGLLHPRPLEAIGIGLLISLLAAAANRVVGRILMRVGERHRSITLRADGNAMTDVYTSLGVVAGLVLVC